MTDSRRAAKSPIERVLSAISVAGLVAGFRLYFRTWRSVVVKRGRLAACATQDEAPISFRSSTAVYLYGVALSFVLYLPLLQIYELQLPKVHFLVQFVYLQVVYVLLMHVSAKAVRGRGRLKDTAGVYCTWVGIASPVIFLLGYPLFAYLPIVEFVDQTSQSVTTLPKWVLIWIAVAFLLMMAGFFLLPLRWSATVHRLKTRWILLGLLFVFFPLIGLHNHFVAPFVAKVLKFTSEFLEKLA
jgi:hypothetical protein